MLVNKSELHVALTDENYKKAMIILGEKSTRDINDNKNQLMQSATTQQKATFEAGGKDARRILGVQDQAENEYR